jgi:tetratricopeptide (TPR) repeat protein
VDDAAARREIPVTEIDRLAGEYRIAVLKNDWPFVPQRQATQFPLPANPIEETAQAWFAKRISWADAMQKALAYYQQSGNVDEAARVAVNVADAFVAAADVQYVAGKLLLRANQPERAGLYVQRALHLNPAPIEYRLSLAEAQAKSGHPEASIATLEAVVKAHPDDERAKYWLGEMRARAAAPAAPAR